MKLKIVVVVFVLLLSTHNLSATIMPTPTICTPIFIAHVRTGIKANFRSGPSTTSPILDTVTSAVGGLPVRERVTDKISGLEFFGICGGGWIAASLMEIEPTLTPTNAIPLQTPTSVVSRTPTSDPCSGAGLPMVGIISGTCVPCTNPCSVLIYSVTLTPTIRPLFGDGMNSTR